MSSHNVGVNIEIATPTSPASSTSSTATQNSKIFVFIQILRLFTSPTLRTPSQDREDLPSTNPKIVDPIENPKSNVTRQMQASLGTHTNPIARWLHAQLHDLSAMSKVQPMQPMSQPSKRPCHPVKPE